MKQLTGVDASFLYMETPTSFGHVSGLSIYQRPDGEFDPYTTFRNQLEHRLPILEPFRRRLVEVPMGLDHPYWIEDPDFDLDFHLRHIAVPPPGTTHELEQLVGRLIGRPLDRSRPLWEAYVIEGLADGTFAILTKLHHATIDGAAGAELLSMLLDVEPGEVRPIEGEIPEPGAVPGTGSMLARTAANLARRPEKAFRLQIQAIRTLGDMTRNQGLGGLADFLSRPLPGALGAEARRRRHRDRAQEDVVPPVPTRPAPATPFNASITAHRVFATGSVPLADIKALKNDLGTTVNDVVMGMVAGALRRYLADRDALPDEPLMAMVPVSLRTGDETDKWTNLVSALFVPLATALDDPIDRIRHVQETMVDAKETFQLVPADLLTGLADFSSPALATRAARLASRARLGDRMRPPVNLVVSNVPGPRVPLYLGRSQLLHYYPVSTIVDGQGLNVTLHSYLDGLDIGLVGCRELIPDLDEIVTYMIDELADLTAAVDQARSASSPKRSTSASKSKSGSKAKSGSRSKAAARKSASKSKAKASASSTN